MAAWDNTTYRGITLMVHTHKAIWEQIGTTIAHRIGRFYGRL